MKPSTSRCLSVSSRMLTFPRFAGHYTHRVLRESSKKRGSLGGLPGLTDRALHEALIAGVGHALQIHAIGLLDAGRPHAFPPVKQPRPALRTVGLPNVERRRDRRDTAFGIGIVRLELRRQR